MALPLASRWYPAEYQGLAMGIVGAGNSGSLMATLFAPRLAERIGWANTFGLAMMPVAGVAMLFALLAKDSPAKAAHASWRDYTDVLREPDTLWFSFLYSLTFGGFVGFTSFLTTFFHEQYHLSRVSAGDFTTVVVVSGSLLRPVGGWLSDRVGGYRLLLFLLAVLAVCVGVVAVLPPLAVVVPMLFVTVGCLGMANGAVFQLVPQRFASRMGIITGVVGAAGGLGGFFLPSILGAAKDATGTYATGLTLFAVAFAVGSFVLLELGSRWSSTRQEGAMKQAGFSATGRRFDSSHLRCESLGPPDLRRDLRSRACPQGKRIALLEARMSGELSSMVERPGAGRIRARGQGRCSNCPKRRRFVTALARCSTSWCS